MEFQTPNPIPQILFSLLMDRTFIIAAAEFFVFYTARLLALILRCRIIALLAFSTF